MIEDLPALGRFHSLRNEGAHSGVFIPIRINDDILGALSFCSREPRRFDERLIQLLETIGKQLGIGIEKTRLHEQNEQNLRHTQALYQIAQATTSTLNLDSVLKLLLEKIELFFPYSAATVRLFDKASGVLEPIACRNLDETEWKTKRWVKGRGLTEVVFQERTPIQIADVRQDPRVNDRDYFRKHNLVSQLGLPLVAKGNSLGVLTLYTRELHTFTSKEIAFLSSLAEQAAIAIDNAQLYVNVQQRETDLKESYHQLETIHHITTASSQSLEVNSILENAAAKISDLFHFEATRVFVSDDENRELNLRASYEVNPQFFHDKRSYRLGEGITGHSAATGKIQIFEDILASAEYESLGASKSARRHGYRFVAAFPIACRIRTCGTLVCIGKEPRRLSPQDIQLLKSIANQIGMSMTNANLYRQALDSARELERKTLDLQEAIKVKDEFLSVMSHELRTPLNVIMGYTGMVQDRFFGDINAEQSGALGKVLKHSNDLFALVSKILVATQIGANHLQAGKTTVEPGVFLSRLQTAFAARVPKNISLEWNVSDAPRPFETDPDKLKDILENLIDNALKFTPKGHVTVSARPITDGQGVEFQVADTGIGIDKETMPFIFDKFRQGDSSETRSYGGIGLGLYIVDRLTKLLGGKIRVESEVGKGSKFTLTIPYQSQIAVSLEAVKTTAAAQPMDD